MISYLEGTLLQKRDDRIVLLAGGIGGAARQDIRLWMY